MNIKVKKYIGLIIFVVILFVLFLLALITQLNEYGQRFKFGNSNAKYVFVIFIILIPILLVTLICLIVKKPRTKHNLSPELFNVNFDELDKKEKIAIVDKRAVRNLKGYDEYVKTNSTGKNGIIVSTNNSKNVENQGTERFYMLSQLDKKYEEYEAPDYNNKVNLREFCEIFRNYSANKKKLYYDISDIRRFVAGLAVTKLIILQGMSGTGKTSLAYAFGQFLDNDAVVVPIQPMWKERTDLIGYYNEFTRKFNETTLLYKMYEANLNDEIYITILDEMNIARVEYYFAEFLSLLEIPELDGRNLDVVADKWETDPKLLIDGKLRLPNNMWFIGTANNDDSTFSISDKVYDRAMVLNLDKKAKPFEAPETEGIKVSVDHLYKLFEEAKKEFKMSDRNLRRIRSLDEYMIQTFHITFGNRIMKQISEYVPVMVACGGTELEAIDDILSRKVFRKLESKNPVYVKSQADALCQYLDDLFGVDKTPLCKEVIRTIEQNV